MEAQEDTILIPALRLRPDDPHCRSTKPVRVRKDGNGCLVVTSHKPSKAGYPRLRYGTELWQMSHFVWMYFYGHRPGPRLFVCHACDNRMCVNVEHLFLGTVMDNNRDMYSKGRGHVFTEHEHKMSKMALQGKHDKRGSKNGNAKLSEKDVKEIRERSMESDSALAREFHVSAKLIALVKAKEVWKHVD